MNYYILVQASSMWLTCHVLNCMHMWAMFLMCELSYFSISFFNMIDLSRIELYVYVVVEHVFIRIMSELILYAVYALNHCVDLIV